MTILKSVCRISDGVGAHHLPGLFFAVSTVTVMLGCTSTTLSTPDQAPGPKCQVTATGPQAAITGIGGSGTIAVNAAPECAWSASTEATWITDISPATGQGAASIQFKAAANPEPVPRQSDIAVSGVLVHVNQEAAPCRFDVKPQNLSIGFTGGSDSVTVTTAAGCAWSALSQANWIIVTSAKENSGSGTVTIDVAAQPDATARTGSIIVAGQAITVSQGARNCTYSINPSSANFATAGGTGSVTVTTPVGCTWTAATNAAWIAVTTGASGNGPGSVAYSVGANSGAARTGMLLIGEQSITINQAAGPCSFGIGPTSQNVTRASGTGAAVTVTTQSFCSWTAVSNDSWITVSPPASGTGNGNVSWTYSANQVPAPRSGTMTIAGQTFTVTQEAGCAYVISPTSQSVGRTAGTGTTVAITTQASCSWTAASNASWISVNTASGSGNGNVGWTYAENTVAVSRTGTMTIAGQTFTVTQDPGCSYVISPTNQSVRDAAGTGTTVTVTTQTACGWTAASNASWITINTGASGSGSVNVGWTYAANPGAARTGSMTIAGQTFTVDQQGPCTFSVAPLGQTLSAPGGAGTPLTVTTQSLCTWVAVSNDPWITVTSGASGTGTGTVNINIAANVVYAARAGTLTIAGTIVTVIQNGVVP